jgi:hypothetical protein
MIITLNFSHHFHSPFAMKSFRAFLLFFLVIALPVTLGIATETATDSDSTELNNPNTQSCGVYLSLPDYLCRNTDDDQGVSSEYYEKWDLDHSPSPGDDDLKVVTVTGTAGPTGGTLTLEITDGSEKINGVFWKDSEKEEEEYPLSWEVLPNESRTVTLYIEGYDHSDEKDDLKMKATMDCPAGTGSDGKNYSAASDEATAETTVYEVDLDVDSNNNEGTTFTSGSKEEDVIEDSQKPNVDGWSKRPGKLVVVNTGNTDGVPDWADGFDTNSSDTEDDLLDGGQADFVEVLVERKDPFTDDCEVMFEYDGSDPKTVATISKDATWNPDHPFAYALGQGGSLRLWEKESESARDKRDAPAGDYLPKDTWIKWSDLEGGSGAVKKLYLEAVRPSGSLGDLSIKVTMRQESVQATDKIVLTNFEFSSEPVNSSDESPLRGHMEEPTNPAGVSGGYYAGYFEVAVKPKNFPDEKIDWTATGGWSTSSTGKFGFISGGAQITPGKASIDIEGIYTPDPEFKGQSLALKTIGAKCVVIRDDAGTNPAISDDAIDELLSKVNKIWRQGGMIFVRQGAVSYIDKSDYSDGLIVSEMEAIIGTYDVSDDEVEIYFVPKIQPNILGYDLKIHGKDGLLVACESLGSSSGTGELAKVVAHEIGHAFYLRDIYWADEGVGLAPPHALVSYMIPDGTPTTVDKTPDDWNGAYWVAPRYYPQDIAHRDILKRLLMNGWADDWEGESRDIPNGTIHGCTHSARGYGPVEVYEGQVNVGLKTLIEHDRKSHH